MIIKSPIQKWKVSSNITCVLVHDIGLFIGHYNGEIERWDSPGKVAKKYFDRNEPVDGLAVLEGELWCILGNLIYVWNIQNGEVIKLINFEDLVKYSLQNWNNKYVVIWTIGKLIVQRLKKLISIIISPQFNKLKLQFKRSQSGTIFFAWQNQRLSPFGVQKENILEVKLQMKVEYSSHWLLGENSSLHHLSQRMEDR